MAGARRSTRQSASTAPKYAEERSSSIENEPPKRQTNTTRRKRAREPEPDHDETINQDEDASPPVKKITKPSKAKATPKPKVAPATRRTTIPPPPVSETNRDPNGAQETFWLLKAEPLPRYENGINVAFSIDDLRACTEPEPWGGVRNPQARNNMQAMRVGDLGFFYHSNAKPSGVVGVLRVMEEAKVDETAFDKKDPYYDPKSDREKPKWFCVGVEFVRKFERVVDLHTIKGFAGKGGKLENMQLVTNGRLSVCKVRKSEWDFIMELAEGDSGEGMKDTKKEEKRIG